MEKYALDLESGKWLKANKFSEAEIKQLAELINILEKHKGNKEPIKIPEDASPKVAAMAYLLESVTDLEGRPLCFKENKIYIPEEAKENFQEDLELEELERITAKFRKVKFARRFSYPRRRNSEKQGSYLPD